eukprot:TRINITY_DN34923_c0_g1_i1.p1 TRINITY_DN34923_c0_g1~~TRINITY_DN34923_c0_g1_i1.p1  ORF type:complete len:569 (-),score=92.71 TRINITY_DN34923_c0_g1_i1:45-1751(-)
MIKRCWPRCQSFFPLLKKTFIAYMRMSATVVIAVVIRLCLDCFGIILTNQDAAAASFWFAHCRRDGACVFAGIILFFTSLFGCSLFAWSCQDWLTDPYKNPYARSFSFALILDASTWIPISVVVGKTNALVEWFMDMAKDDLLQALLSSLIAAALTITCAILTHLTMKYCRDVQGSLDVKEAGWSGFGKFFLLASLYCFGWAVGWSNWELVMSLLDAVEPGRSMHDAMLSAGVISAFLFLSTCVYLRFGPEPIIPDPQLQKLCYNHGYSSSIRRALVSYVVFTCVVALVMCFCDPNYGFLIVFTQKVLYDRTSSTDDLEALLILCGLSCVVTGFAAMLSAGITWAMQVDEFSSMKLSRSVHNSCQRMISSRRSKYETLLTQVMGDGSDVRFLEAQGREMQNMQPSVHSDFVNDNLDDMSEDGEIGENFLTSDHDKSTGLLAPSCNYNRLDFDIGAKEDLSDVDSERQLWLDPGAISRTLCASVLIYDVLGLVVCFLWGMIALRFYTVVFGRLASLHDILYVLTCLIYAGCVVVSLPWVAAHLFPSEKEKIIQLMPRDSAILELHCQQT